MRAVLKRATTLYAVFAFLVALVVGIASAAQPAVPNFASRVLVLLIQPAFAWTGWIYGPAARTDPPALGESEVKEPVLWLHSILGVDALIGLLLLYFLVCLILAWCWTWIESRTASRRIG
jgi:hypothetical protein